MEPEIYDRLEAKLDQILQAIERLAPKPITVKPADPEALAALFKACAERSQEQEERDEQTPDDGSNFQGEVLKRLDSILQAIEPLAPRTVKSTPSNPVVDLRN